VIYSAPSRPRWRAFPRSAGDRGVAGRPQRPAFRHRGTRGARTAGAPQGPCAATDTILNVNVPDLPYAELAGFEATRLGNRHKAEPVIKSADPHGNPIYWVARPGPRPMPVPAPTFMLSASGGCRSHRCMSISPATLPWRRWPAGWRRHDCTPVRHRHDSARTRERLVGRLREAGIRSEAVLDAMRRIRATCSSTKRWRTAPMKTPHCPSVTTRPYRSRTRWRT